MSLNVPNEILNEIAEQLTKMKPPGAANEDLRDAWFTLQFSVGPSGATLEGWITYWDQVKVHITLAEVTAQRGTAVASTSIPVWVRVPPVEKLINPGAFDASGFSLGGGIIEMSNIGQVNLVGAAPWDWRLAGSVRFEKA